MSGTDAVRVLPSDWRLMKAMRDGARGDVIDLREWSPPDEPAGDEPGRRLDTPPPAR